MLTSFGFGQPWWLMLLPLLGYWFWRYGGPAGTAAILHSTTAPLMRLGVRRTGGPGRILRSVRLLAMGLLVLAMARPRIPQGEMHDPTKGIDIMLTCDVSGSMDTRDFSLGAEKITRREALTRAISEFVDARTSDRIGMIGFAKHTYLLSPLTVDGNWIKEVLKLVELKNDGTAIGDGMIAGVNKLQESADRSKVMIVVTDGMNNSGVNPLDAADYAREKGVRVYTLEIMNLRGIKTASALKSPLSHVAQKTGGQYFQAADTGALTQIYRQIDRMEKHEIDASHHQLYHELALWLVLPGLGLILFEWIAAQTFWMRLP